MNIQIMAYSMKLGINAMNYMFYGNNDSFVVYLKILDLPPRTGGRNLSVFSRIRSESEPMGAYFLCNWGKLSPIFFRDGFLQCP